MPVPPSASTRPAWQSAAAADYTPPRKGLTSVGVEALACEIRSGLDNTLSEAALQVAVDVEPKLLEPGQTRLRPGAPSRFTEVGQRRGKLAVRRQRDPVDVRLGARDRFAVEPREP